MTVKEKTPAPAKPLGFFDLLLASTRTSGTTMSPMESRLVEIAVKLMQNMVLQVRCAEPSREPLPLSAEVVEYAARLSLVGAAEMESQLHRLRDAATSRQHE
jgi:hypothetical protein